MALERDSGLLAQMYSSNTPFRALVGVEVTPSAIIQTVQLRCDKHAMCCKTQFNLNKNLYISAALLGLFLVLASKKTLIFSFDPERELKHCSSVSQLFPCLKMASLLSAILSFIDQTGR